MSFHSQHHSFDIHLASKYGMEEAIIIHHMQHWIRLNRRKKKNIREGKCWMFQSMENIADHFPYLNYEKVKYAIENLVKQGVLMKGNFNRLNFDKTNWYAFVDEFQYGVDEKSSNNLYERENSPSIGKIPQRGGKIPEPIPDTKKEDAKECNDKSLQIEAPAQKPDATVAPIPKKKIERAKHVATTEEEHEKLVKEFGKDNTNMAYTVLSEWKQDKPKARWRKNDYLSILRWVMDSLKDKKKTIKIETKGESKTVWKGKKIL